MIGEQGKEGISDPLVSSQEDKSSSNTKLPLEEAVHLGTREKWEKIWRKIRGKAPKTQEQKDKLAEFVQTEEDEIFAGGDLARKQQERSDKETFTDSLTGLPNRRAFDRALDRAFERVHRINRKTPGAATLTAAMFDLDHFKKVNDTLGHLGGDVVLKAVADVLAEAFQRTGSDFVGRYGGEEFIALIENRYGNGTGDEVERRIVFLNELIAKINENVNATLGKSADPKLREAKLNQTASIGVATLEFNANGDPIFSPGQLIKNADKAVYKAKADGRARVVPYDPSLAEINTGS